MARANEPEFERLQDQMPEADREWYERMAKLEDGQEIGAGLLARDPVFADAQHYAAAIYAITNTRPEMTAEERAALAEAIVSCQRERGLIPDANT
jgi:hypothetical protein